MAQAFAGTYDPNAPFGSDLHTVRTNVGDVNEDAFLVSDGLITGRIAQTADLDFATLCVFDDMLVKLSHETDTSGGRSSSLRSQRITQISEAKDRFRAKMGRRPAITISNATDAQHETLDTDTSLRQPRNRIGRDDIDGSCNCVSEATCGCC